MMNEPSIEKLTSNGLNRYQIVIATAKVAREIIKEYNEEDKLINADEKTVVKKTVHDDKPVKTAVHALDEGEYRIVLEGDEDVAEEALTEEAQQTEEQELSK